MAGLIDLGDGIKAISGQVQATGGSGASSAIQQASGLLDLQQKKLNLQNAPLERIKLESQAKLINEQAKKAQVETWLKNAELSTKEFEQQRLLNKERTGMYKEIMDMMKVNPNIAKVMLAQFSPDSSMTINDDGTATVQFATSTIERDEKGVLTEVPKEERLTVSLTQLNSENPEDREKRLKLEGQWNDRLKKDVSVKNFPEQSAFYKNMLAAGKKATGASDISIIFSFMKMMDPGGRVTDGEVALASQVPNVPTQILNLYNKAISSDAPIFGEAGSKTRQQFLDTGKLFYQNARSNALNSARDIADFARRENLNIKNIISPIGDISEQEIISTDEDLLKDLDSMLGE